MGLFKNFLSIFSEKMHDESLLSNSDILNDSEIMSDIEGWTSGELIAKGGGLGSSFGANG